MIYYTTDSGEGDRYLSDATIIPARSTEEVLTAFRYKYCDSNDVVVGIQLAKPNIAWKRFVGKDSLQEFLLEEKLSFADVTVLWQTDDEIVITFNHPVYVPMILKKS